MSRGSLSSRLVVAAVLVLAALAAVDSIRGGPPAAPTSPVDAPVNARETQHAGGRRAIERIGAQWARALAANGLADCFHTGEELCARLHCAHIGLHVIPNCRRPTAAYRRTFRHAAVRDVLIKQDEAVAVLSNGEAIELHADRGTWWVLQLGRGAGRGFFEKPG